jgi:hypothetical protein
VASGGDGGGPAGGAPGPEVAGPGAGETAGTGDGTGAGEAAGTGQPGVDLALARLEEAEGVPAERQVEIYDEVHRRLFDALHGAGGDSGG